MKTKWANWLPGCPFVHCRHHRRRVGRDSAQTQTQRYEPTNDPPIVRLFLFLMLCRNGILSFYPHNKLMMMMMMTIETNQEEQEEEEQEQEGPSPFELCVCVCDGWRRTGVLLLCSA